MRTASVYMKFDPELKQKMSKSAKNSGMSMTTLVHMAVAAYLGADEDAYYEPLRQAS